MIMKMFWGGLRGAFFATVVAFVISLVFVGGWLGTITFEWLGILPEIGALVGGVLFMCMIAGAIAGAVDH